MPPALQALSAGVGTRVVGLVALYACRVLASAAQSKTIKKAMLRRSTSWSLCRQCCTAKSALILQRATRAVGAAATKGLQQNAGVALMVLNFTLGKLVVARRLLE
eukprot:gnl/TRDRNA2_/TRDRNA2_116255_c1_seq1.p3 gnl/TRDRNA2_/TRDRNA2_116255_c1~~gnl/TRDRNA2_/TRDRNA2_116255_c1_seq1.p3  ORF type:complete len:105 (-),score=18.23 gnl/TRDRNA2_/TRDRNA2_116255_c1_seq1:272-586(-)